MIRLWREAKLLLADLSATFLYAVASQRAQSGGKVPRKDTHMHEGHLALLIPIFGIVVGLGFPLATLIVFLFLEHRKRRRLMELHHTERMAAIERGMDVPPLPLDLLRGRPRRRRSGLLPGLIGAFAGFAFLAIGGIIDEEGPLIAGSLFLAIGAAFLVYYVMEGRKTVAANGENNGAAPAATTIEEPR